MKDEIFLITTDNGNVIPDTSNIYNKREFTFLIEAFLKDALKNCNICPKQCDELMEYWEKW